MRQAAHQACRDPLLFCRTSVRWCTGRQTSHLAALGNRRKSERLEGMSGPVPGSTQPTTADSSARRIIRNFSMQAGGEVLGQLLAFVTALRLAHILDPHGFGVWVFASSVLLYFTIVIDGGTDVWGAREAAARPRRLSRLVHSIFRLRLLLCAVSAIIVVIFSWFTDPDERTALIGGIPILLVFAFNTSWAHRGLETGLTGVAILCQRACWLVLAFTVIDGPADALYATFWQSVSEGIGALLLYVYLRSDLKRNADTKPAIPIGSVYAHSWPLAVARAMRALTAALAIVVLGSASLSSEVGYYGAALRIATIVTLISAVFSHSVFPGLARACRGDEQGPVIAAAMRLLVALVAPIAIGGFWLAEPMVRAIFPAGFASAGAMLEVLMLALAAMSVSDLLRRILAARHRQRLDLNITAFATFVSIASTIWLGIRFGGIGAAFAMLLGELTLMILAWVAVARTGPAVQLLRGNYRAIIGVVMMILGLEATAQLPIGARVVAGAVIYLSWMSFGAKKLHADLKLLNDAR